MEDESLSFPFASALDAWIASECSATPKTLCQNLLEAQIASFGETLRLAQRKSRFYAKHLQGYNLAPKTLQDIAHLPFMTAKDLIPYENLLCVSLGDVERIITLQTSGTTAPPKRIAFSRKDLARIVLFFAQGMTWLCKQKSSLAVLLPGSERPDGIASLLRQALVQRAVSVAAAPSALLKEDALPSLITWLISLKPNVLVAMPAQLTSLLCSLPNGLPTLTGVLSSAEPLSSALKSALQSKWNVTVLDHYGLTEAGLGCAVECPCHDGYHLRAMDLFVEIVGIEDGKPLSAHEVGEVVITTLGREAMPLIRYRTGDVASMLSSPCACGSPLPRLGQVLGRIERDSFGLAQIAQPPKGGRA